MENMRAKDFLGVKMSWCFPYDSPAYHEVIKIMEDFGKIKWDEAQRSANDFRVKDETDNYPAKTRTPYK